MLRNNNAFTLIEVLIAASILFLSLAFIIPSFIILHHERQNLYSEIDIIQQLEKGLYHAANNEHFTPFHTFGKINNTKVKYSYAIEDDLIVGCATWETTKKQEKSTCLYK